jgi:hypothetical protein
VGLLVATWGVRLLVKVNPGEIARIEESSVDGRVLGFTCAVVALAGLVAGVIPALHASKTNVNETPKTPASKAAAGKRSERWLKTFPPMGYWFLLVELADGGRITAFGPA